MILYIRKMEGNEDIFVFLVWLNSGVNGNNYYRKKRRSDSGVWGKDNVVS